VHVQKKIVPHAVYRSYRRGGGGGGGGGEGLSSMIGGSCRCPLCSLLSAAATLMCWHRKCHWQAAVFLSAPSSIQAQPRKYYFRHVHIPCCIALLQAADSRHKHACISCLPAFLSRAGMTHLPRNTPSCAPPLSRLTPTKSEQLHLHLQQTAELSCHQ
jgi:hypothetical protein